MNKYIRYIITSFLVVIILPSFASKKESDKDEWTPNQRKAEYFFLEGLRMKALDKNDAFFELVRRAHELDPQNSVISYYLGYNYLLMSNKERERVNVGLALMKEHIDAVPEDYYENYFYGDVNNKLGYPDEALRIWERMAKIFPEKIELRYMLADGYANTRKYAKAIETYDSLEVTEGKSLPITVRKVNYYLSLNDTINALRESKDLLNTAPRNIQYNLLLGDLFLQLNKQDSALACYNRAQEIEPDNGFVNLSKASFYNSIGDSANYDNQIYKALINDNLVVESKLSVLTDYICQLMQENDSSARVDKLFNVLISQHPHEIQIHQLYSKYLVAKPDYKAAAEQLSYALDIDPTSAEDWKKLMFINLMAGDYSKAIEAAQKSLTYNPDNIELYQYIAPAYYQMKEYDKALKVYNEALEKIDSTDVELRSNIYGGIGDVYFTQGDSTLAFETYEKALDLNPGNISILNNYAYFLAESGKDLDKAEKMSALSVKGSPNNPTFLDTYAWIFFKKGEYKLAKIYIESALANSKEQSPELNEHYGDILFMNGEPEKALEEWEKALKLKPDSELLNRKVKNKTYFFK